MQALAGPVAATIITALILWVAFASVFSGTLGYSVSLMLLQEMVHFLACSLNFIRQNIFLTYHCLHWVVLLLFLVCCSKFKV
jgi:hypothetical protein